MFAGGIIIKELDAVIKTVIPTQKGFRLLDIVLCVDHGFWLLCIVYAFTVMAGKIGR